MQLWSQIIHVSSAVREFVTPTYRPELHYMRGPGPANRRRAAMRDGRRQEGSRAGGSVPLMIDHFR